MQLDSSQFETREDATKYRHELANKVTSQFALYEARMQKLEKHNDDIILTKQAVTDIRDDLDEIKDMMKEFISQTEERLNEKLDKGTFSAWKTAAVISIGLIASSIFWILLQLYNFNATIQYLPYETVKVLKQDVQFTK